MGLVGLHRRDGAQVGAALGELVEQRGLARVAGPHQQHHVATRAAQQQAQQHCEAGRGAGGARVAGGWQRRRWLAVGHRDGPIAQQCPRVIATGCWGSPSTTRTARIATTTPGRPVAAAAAATAPCAVMAGCSAGAGVRCPALQGLLGGLGSGCCVRPPANRLQTTISTCRARSQCGKGLDCVHECRAGPMRTAGRAMELAREQHACAAWHRSVLACSAAWVEPSAQSRARAAPSQAGSAQPGPVNGGSDLQSASTAADGQQAAAPGRPPAPPAL